MSDYSEEREALYREWEEGEKRMEDIGPNGNDGDPYNKAGYMTASNILSKNAEYSFKVDEYMKSIQDSGIESATERPSKYHRRIERKGGWSDVYSVTDAYDVTSAPIAHAIKKLLCTGTRGYKDFQQDLQEAIDSLERAKDFPPVPF